MEINQGIYGSNTVNSFNQLESNDLLQLKLDELQRSLNPSERNGGIVYELKSLLTLIMNDCVINNIENGKNWFFQNCQTQIQAQSIMNYVVELARSTMIYKQRLHLLYLTNDILHHADLYNSDRRQQHWIKEAILPQLAMLLNTVYHCPSDNINESQQKVMKVVNIWNEKNIFNSMIINRLKFDITQPTAPPLSISHHPPNFYHHPHPPSFSHPPMPHPPIPHPPVSNYPSHLPMTNPPSRPLSHLPMANSPSRPPPHLPMANPPSLHSHPISNPPPLHSHLPISNLPSRPPIPNLSSYPPAPNPPKQETPVIIKKKYYELPAGLMAISLKIDHPPYTPIDPLSIQSKPQRPVPSKEMLNAIDQFYSGLENNEKSNTESNDLHIIGWERGFLDSFYKKFQTKFEQKTKNTSPAQHKHKDHDDGRNRRRNESSSRRRSPSYDRGRSPRRDRNSERRRSRYYSRSRSRSYSRSRSDSRSRSYSRSRSRSYSRSRSRSRSRSPRRSHYKQINQRSRQRSTSRDRYKKSSRSSPPLPSSSSLPLSTSTNAPALYSATSGSGRIGLGHSSTAAGDAFDEFRKRSSYNFIKEINRRDASGGPKCYNCGNYGHFARNCDANN